MSGALGSPRRGDELVRLLARPRLDPDAARTLRLADEAGVDWAAVMARARIHGLGILAGRRLREHGIEPGTRVADSIAAEQRSAAAWALALTAETTRLIGVLESGGVATLPLKGPALAAAAYGDVTLRRSGDIDLLVARADLPRAERVLAAAGIQPERTASAGEREWYRRTHDKLVHLSSPLVTLEIHGRVHPPDFCLELEGPGLWQRARTTELGGARVRTMSLEDTLLVVCTHAGRSGWMRLEWAASVAWLARRDDLDWELAAALARRLGAMRMLAVGLELARTIDPEPIAAAERLHRGDPRAARLARGLAAAQVTHREGIEQRPGKRAVLRHRLGHLRLRERWRDRASYVLRVALVPTDADARLVDLPAWLAWLYVPVRVGRLAAASVRMVGR